MKQKRKKSFLKNKMNGSYKIAKIATGGSAIAFSAERGLTFSVSSGNCENKSKSD